MIFRPFGGRAFARYKKKNNVEEPVLEKSNSEEAKHYRERKKEVEFSLSICDVRYTFFVSWLIFLILHCFPFHCSVVAHALPHSVAE